MGSGGQVFASDPSVVPAGVKATFAAHGGIFNKPTLAVIGEAGPEAVIPLRRGGGGGVGATIIGPLVSVGGNVMGADLTDLVEQAITELERRGVILRLASA